eukprot:4619449-Pyramimonas_sp.AAC.1
MFVYAKHKRLRTNEKEAWKASEGGGVQDRYLTAESRHRHRHRVVVGALAGPPRGQVRVVDPRLLVAPCGDTDIKPAGIPEVGGRQVKGLRGGPGPRTAESSRRSRGMGLREAGVGTAGAFAFQHIRHHIYPFRLTYAQFAALTRS